MESIKIFIITSLFILIQVSVSIYLIWNAIVSIDFRIEVNGNKTILMSYQKGIKSLFIEVPIEQFKVSKKKYYGTEFGNTTRYTFSNLDKAIVWIEIRNRNKTESIEMESILTKIEDFI